MMYDDEKELRNYIFEHYAKLVSTINEIAAHKNFIFLYQKDFENSQFSSYKGVYNSEINKIMENGFEDFKSRISKRILENHQKDIVVNRCPKCNKLTRTPEAKQCRYCYFGWH